MELLWRFNPWWEEKDWQERDKHLLEYNMMEIKWLPNWLEQISLEPFSLNFVVGPRQVGKTTGLKLLIKNLNENPFQILYLDLEIFTDLKEFREALIYYFNLRERKGIKNSYIILDEVSSLDGWYRIVKAFIDLGEFRNDIIIATGSSTINVLKHAESFVGRRGKGKDIISLPLSFSELVKVIGVNVERADEVKKMFNFYLKYGGFPKSINRISSENEFIKSFEREITKLDKSVEIAKKIISSLFEMLPSALSYNSIAQKIGISNKTVENYIEIFEDLFLAKVIYFKEKEVIFRKEKKIMFRDPFILNSFGLWCNKEVRKDFLYENIVQEHLFRKFGEVYYYRNRYEIDCIAKDLKVEVKAGKPHRKYPKGVKVLDGENIAEFLVNLFK